MLLRPAKPEDAIAVAHVHVRSWQAAYRKLLPNEYLDRLRPEDRAQKYDFANDNPLKPHTIIAVANDIIHGFVTTAPSREPDLATHGELCALYVDPEQWGRHFGVSLVSAARTRLLDIGFQQAFLWILAGNTRAGRFYQKDGWEPDSAHRTASVWGIAVNELRYQRVLK